MCGHYWSYGIYDYYGDLDEEGYIVRDYSLAGDADFNFNAFNTDLIFGWQFGPGSFLNIVYKNALQRDEQIIQTSYFDNLGAVLEQGQLNSITMSCTSLIRYPPTESSLSSEQTYPRLIILWFKTDVGHFLIVSI
ncbi:MAG: hypothetical protein DCO96_15755 [Fluviicola sp. XM-24bin1]|nr:MAG: hypothetical protein DCO96_15755 [Fluviicola sp. XM-24bin1]